MIASGIELCCTRLSISTLVAARSRGSKPINTGTGGAIEIIKTESDYMPNLGPVKPGEIAE